MTIEESNLISHAKRELLAVGYVPLDQDQEDGPDKWVQENILELLEVFQLQGHSGFSASYVINVFNKLAHLEPLGPLQGTDDEWVEVGEGIWQNNRCSHVFKDTTHAYDIEGRIFREPDGTYYTGSESKVTITFPYTPSREYVDVESGHE